MSDIFNLAYEMLSWRIHRALTKAKLEPFLGFLHAAKYERPSLTCDFVELYRFFIEDFLINQCTGYSKKDFSLKTEVVRGKVGKRQYLNDCKTKEFMRKLNLFFEKKMEVPRICFGKRQTFNTLICEEALLLGKFLRDEQKKWIPRILV